MLYVKHQSSSRRPQLSTNREIGSECCLDREWSWKRTIARGFLDIDRYSTGNSIPTLRSEDDADPEPGAE